MPPAMDGACTTASTTASCSNPVPRGRPTVVGSGAFPGNPSALGALLGRLAASTNPMAAFDHVARSCKTGGLLGRPCPQTPHLPAPLPLPGSVSARGAAACRWEVAHCAQEGRGFFSNRPEMRPVSSAALDPMGSPRVRCGAVQSHHHPRARPAAFARCPVGC